MVVSAERMLRSSHTLTERSSEPDTTLSSRVKTVEVTLLEGKRNFCLEVLEVSIEGTYSVCPWNTDTAGMLSRKSHSLKVESREAVTTRR